MVNIAPQEGEQISQIVEEYLEAIYRLEEKEGWAKTSEIAQQMQVALGTITNTVKRLKKQGYIVHKPYKGVKLTVKGRKIALNVIMKHRLAERLLTDILHMDWDKSHELACRLEHSLTEDMIKSLRKVLGHPKTCPHGNPIPTSCGGVFEDFSKPLIDFKPGSTVVIVKIADENREILNYLSSLHLKPGVKVKIGSRDPFGEYITIEINSDLHVLNRRIAAAVYGGKQVSSKS